MQAHPPEGDKQRLNILAKEGRRWNPAWARLARKRAAQRRGHIKHRPIPPAQVDETGSVGAPPAPRQSADRGGRHV